MPHYFFDLYNDVVSRDEEGQDFADVESAMVQAASYAREMAAESVRTGHLNLAHYIELRNPAGEALGRVTFGEAVKVIKWA